jgi:hypothetical protein
MAVRINALLKRNLVTIHALLKPIFRMQSRDSDASGRDRRPDDQYVHVKSTKFGQAMPGHITRPKDGTDTTITRSPFPVSADVQSMDSPYNSLSSANAFPGMQSPAPNPPAKPDLETSLRFANEGTKNDIERPGPATSY